MVRRFSFKGNSTFYVFVILLFGLVSIFLAYPLSTGDEGFHLSKSYYMFSSNNPEEASEQYLRNIELTAISNPKQISVKEFYFQKVPAIEKDGIGFQAVIDSNITSRVDIGHLVPALGVLVGRLIYPSYGVMLLLARFFNLLFFAIGMFFIFKRYNDRLLTYFMIFTVPFMQKIASPSYDVFAFLTIALFGTNVLYLSQFKKISEVSGKDRIYTLFTILLIFLTKRNYIFALIALIGLPIIYTPLLNIFKKMTRVVKIVFVSMITIFASILLLIIHKILNIKYLIKIFFDNYFNTATMGGRGLTLFSVVQDNLPDIVNILWLICLALVMLSEGKRKYSFPIIISSILAYLLNWIGIFVGFYILKTEIAPFDDLTGRYLHAYIIFLIPLTAYLGQKMNIRISKCALERIATISTICVLFVYIVTVFYRGFILGVTPAWKN